MAKRRPRGRPGGSPARRDPLERAPVAAGPSPSGRSIALEDLAGYVADRRELEDLIAETVAAARAQGATWTALAGALGVTPQAVQKRYGSRGS